MTNYDTLTITNDAENYYYVVDHVVTYYDASTHVLVDAEDLRSYLNEEFFKLLGKADESRGDKEMFYKQALFSKARRYFTEEQGVKLEREVGVGDYSDYTEQSFTRNISVSFEEEVISTRDLPVSDGVKEVLTHCTEVQKRIVIEIVTNDEVHNKTGLPSVSKIGRALGLHHEKVRRELRGLQNISNLRNLLS